MTFSHSSKDPLRPPVSGGQFAGAMFEKASDTSLCVLRAKLRNSSSDSATVWENPCISVDFV